MSIVTESEFKGNAMIVIKNNEDDQFPFQFGVKKAKMVLENIEEIKKFVAKHDKS
jgi:hypothetical protein